MMINGTPNQDELYANKNDQVFGFEGDDILDASNGQGNNLLDGGAGNDQLFANNYDTLIGGVGEDSLFALGSSGFNKLEGGEDNDRLFIVEGGNNTLDGGSGSDRLTVSGGTGYNTLLGGVGSDFLDVSSGTGNNSLDGGDGDDVLIGGLASDRLFGGAGDDLLFAGKKGSQLTGGTGRDSFYITSAAVPEVPPEVLDFTKGDDKVLVAGIPEVKAFSDLKLEQTGLDTTVKANINGTLKELGILRNVQANTLTPDDFGFDSINAIFSINSASAVEGNAIAFTITRTGDTQTNQSVSVSTFIVAGDTASNNDFAAKAETITFKQGETQKTFTVQTTADAIVEDNETFSVNLSNPTNGSTIGTNGGTAKGTIINVGGNSSAGVTITESNGNTKVTEGGANDDYLIVLASQPTADVTIAVNSGKQITTNTKTLTFTTQNWNVAQKVTVAAVDDAVVEGNHSDIIQHTATSSDTKYNGIKINAVNVSITDNDIPLAKSADNDVFTIKGDSNKAQLQVTLTGGSSSLVNELGLFTVDDTKGTINGIAPGATGYAQAALDRAKVIFSTLANVPNGFNANNLNSLLELNSGDNLRFLLVKNSSFDSVRAGATPIADILFADPATQKITDLGNNGFSLAWKTTSSGDFQDLVVNIKQTNNSLPLGTNLQGKAQGEVIDLRNVTQQVKAEFVVNREAAFNNFVGFYQVVDENGGIDTNGDGKADILAGQAGYTQAAVRGRVAGIDLIVNNQGSASYTGIFKPGAIFAPFLIVDGRADAILDTNPNNDPSVYFPYLGANADTSDHIRLFGNNIFGFEDLPNGGDKDFNDVIVKVNLSIA
ncbi:DUF4114 domain-containing protein [Calothrix sp. PCC 7507]|uniref:DUF4114 domain-containing protein n=1 Tax=Calothrix sp. PCC 7507 TaxID=99598 RepID=UPI00029EE344|nr:DUF4114 domain-containing protein [Calothrix sp. PCC 7507]AFY32944.1 Na-Ca exchanger/integrin-beta4 [Calothrix sp. PCC 7507]